LRIILDRIWAQQESSREKVWWSVQEYPEFLDHAFWGEKYQSESLQVGSLSGYIERLSRRIDGELARLEPPPPPPVSQPTPARENIFISYSHKDVEWLQKLLVLLDPLTDKIDIWADTKVKPGAEWKKEISNAMASAKVAILLVSPDFLASPFIKTQELPYILEVAENEGLTIFWIHVRDCLYRRSQIKKYQGAHDVGCPLNGLPPGEQERVLANIARKLAEHVSPTMTHAT
jgi:hypothetical protein